MRDRNKIILLAVFSSLFICYFLFQGLTLDNYEYFLSKRGPKIIALVLAAIAIAISSLVFQTITNNRILTPSILGFDSLYVLIQVLLVVSFGSLHPLISDTRINFALSTVLMTALAMLLFRFYFRRPNANIFNLLLIGVILSSLFGSVTNFFTLLIDPNEFTAIQAAMFASFNNIKSELVYLSIIPLLLCAYLLYRFCHKLDVMWLGEDNAKSLGINTQKLMLQIMLLVSLLIAISTALVGPVLFFGLIVVAVTRQVFISYRHQTLMLASSLVAVSFLIFGQWVVEHLLDFGTTLSVLINLVGGSYFLLLLVRQKI